MYLFSIEPNATRETRLGNLARRVLHRLADSDQKIWTLEETEGNIRLAAREMVAEVEQLIWDMVYVENLPNGMSHTGDFEVPYLTFFYGRANYTAEFEQPYADEVLETDDTTWANNTSPSDRAFLDSVGASTAVQAISDLPPTLVQIDRATWDRRTITAGTTHRARLFNDQYQIEFGEVFAYLWQGEGPRTFRKVLRPSEAAPEYEVQGSWGIVRDLDDVTDVAESGTWGIPRRIPDYFPSGDTQGWGTPRRFYRWNKNVKVEHWRQFVHTWTESELPERYFLYLGDYAQWKALIRNGPGQDYKLAQLYKDRWTRNLERVKSRVRRINQARTVRMGGDGGIKTDGPPRPRLPWQFGQIVR